MSAYSKLYNRQKRAEVLDFFGRCCVRCGFDDVRALQVDHVNGGGRQSDLAHGGSHMAIKLVAMIRADPEAVRRKYQLLCANCNWIKRAENHEHGGDHG